MGPRMFLRQNRAIIASAAGPLKLARRGLVGFSGHINGTLQTKGPIVGAFAECTHSFQQEDVNIFAKICGDNNPLHTNVEVASKSMFQGTIVHGILVSSLFSTLFGASMHGAVYVNQTLSFKRPVHVGASVTARIHILQKEQKRSGHLLTCSTTVTLSDGSAAILGEALCLLPYTDYPREE